MKKNFSIFFLLLLLSLNVFSEEWISDNGQKLIFVNRTAIKFNENFLPDFGPKISGWKNAIIGLSIGKGGNIFCEIIISRDDYALSRSENWIRFDLYTELNQHIEDNNQRKDFLALDFVVRLRNELSRGTIEQYAALQRYQGMVVIYPDTHLNAGNYTADLRYESNYDLFPKYNEVAKSWNAAYIYQYIVGNFEEIKDMPVPPGLDDSFKNALDKTPLVIENKDWATFISYVKTYDLKLDRYFSNLLKYNAPVSVFEAFPKEMLRKFKYDPYIPYICSNVDLLIFFYDKFSKSEIEILLNYFKEKPDDYVDFCKVANLEFSSLDPNLPVYFVKNCSVDNVEYITRSYDISLVTSILSKIENERIEKILKNRDDDISNFLKFYYLDFDTVTADKLIYYSGKLNLDFSHLLMTNVYEINKPVLEKLIGNENYSKVIEDLFEKDLLKLIVINSSYVQISTDFDSKGIDIWNYKNSRIISQILNEPVFEISYKLYSGEILLDELFKPYSIIIDNCKFSLTLDSVETYSFLKKNTGSFLFGELKNNKLIKKNIFITNSQNETLLFTAIRNGNDVLAQQLIKDGIDITVQNIEGKTALDVASELGNAKIEKLLRNHK